MKKWNLFLILCISLLLSGCQKTLESPSAARSETAPWEAESQDAQSSYNDLTQETRPQGSRKMVRISGRPPKYIRSCWASPVQTSGRAG